MLLKSGDVIDKHPVLVVAPTAAAARLIGVEIIEAVSKMRQGDIEILTNFSDDATTSYYFENLRLLIMDEVSLIGSAKLQVIHVRQLLGRPTKQPFGGLSAICSGDFQQLPSMKKRWILLQRSLVIHSTYLVDLKN